MRVAVLDVDGTLFPGSVGLCMLDALARRGICDSRQVEAVLEPVSRYRAGSISYEEMAHTATVAYAVAISGLGRAAVAAIADEVWREERGRLFHFVRPLLTALSGAGFSPVLLSAGPSEIIACIAADLGVPDYHGSRFATVDGVFVGSCEIMPGEAGGKVRLLESTFPRCSVDLTGSFAMGNSSNDIGVLSQVGHPVAFEPEPELRLVAAERGWFIADRSTILRHVAELTGGRVVAHAPGDGRIQ